MDSISVQRHPAQSEVPQIYRPTGSPRPPAAAAREALRGSSDHVLFGRLSPRGRRRAPAGRLPLHVPVGEKPGQECVGRQAATHLAPVPKRLIRQIGEIERFPPGKAERAIVVRVVAGFLKLDEGGGDVDQRLLNRLAIQAGCEPGRYRPPGERNGGLLHCGVVKGAGETVTQRAANVARQHELCRFVDQKVKEGVIGSRYRAAKAGLGRFLGFLAGEEMRLFQQLRMKAHAECWTSDAPRKRT